MSKKMVFGLDASITCWCGKKGKWRKTLPKILRSFENPVLISAANSTYLLAEVLHQVLDKDRILLDSGGFTLYKKQDKLEKEEFEKLCKRMKMRLLKFCAMGEYSQIFELDNEYFREDDDLVSPKNYLRQEIKDVTGEYPTPVFKMHQGFKYWKDLCDSDLYPRLSIGGLAPTRSWHTHRDELVKMMNYARQKEKNVHLLGCQNVETFKLTKPDSIDTNIALYSVNFAAVKKEFPDLEPNSDEFYQAMAVSAFARAKSRSFLYDTL